MTSGVDTALCDAAPADDDDDAAADDARVGVRWRREGSPRVVVVVVVVAGVRDDGDARERVWVSARRHQGCSRAHDASRRG